MASKLSGSTPCKVTTTFGDHPKITTMVERKPTEAPVVDIDAKAAENKDQIHRSIDSTTIKAPLDAALEEKFSLVMGDWGGAGAGGRSDRGHGVGCGGGGGGFASLTAPQKARDPTLEAQLVAAEGELRAEEMRHDSEVATAAAAVAAARLASEAAQAQLAVAQDALTNVRAEAGRVDTNIEQLLKGIEDMQQEWA